ncbi:MAG: hypothetical protein K1Y02_19655 [Candidatus Hydrogenedentes bacterium]|nr:hypothetical protein [Candidatus Hydrogenedentota bacterium]
MSRRVSAVLSVVVSMLLAASCAHVSIENEHVKKAATSLAKVERLVDAWGTASISIPLLVENKGQFALDYSKDPKEYVESAKSGYQGTVQRSLEQSLNIQTSSQTQLDLNGFIQFIQSLGPKKVDLSISPANGGEGTTEGEGGTGDTSTGTTTDTAATVAKAAAAAATGNKGILFSGGQGGFKFGEGPDTSLSIERGEVAPSTPALTSKLPLTNQAAGVLSSEKFAAPLPAATPPSAISERQALLIGLNDKLTENVLKYLANPAGISKTQKAYLAIFEVSCNPGWKTRKGYICDINVTLDYARPKNASGERAVGARRSFAPAPQKQGDGAGSSDKEDPFEDDFEYSSLEDTNSRQPSALSIFPSTEAQVLDLRNSEREQIALASYLSALLMGAGQQHMSEVMGSYAERLSYDAATRTPIPVVTSYTDGWSFGFRVMPSFQALGDPLDKEKGSANVLNPYSFPAVVLLICEEGELDVSKKGWDRIVFQTSSRWIPAERRDYVGTAIPMSKYFSRYVLNLPDARPMRFAMSQRIGMATELGRAMEEMELAVDQGGRIWGDELGELERRYRTLEAQALGESVLCPIPPQPAKPTYKDLEDAKRITFEPDHGWFNAPTAIAISGAGLSKGNVSVVKAVQVGGRECTLVATGVNTVVALVPAWHEVIAGNGSTSPSAKVTVVTNEGLLTSDNAITFDRKLPSASADPTIEVERNANGLVTKITVAGTDEVSGSALLQAIKDILEAQDVDVDVKLDLKTSK